MTRIRYVRVVGVAVAITAISMIGIVLSDSKLVEAAGLDVWNIGRLEDQLRAANVAGDRLLVQHDTNQSQFQLNQAIICDVANGKRKLHEAAEQLWKMNGHTPSYTQILPDVREGPTIIAKVAHNVILLASQELRNNPLQQRQLVSRLRAEYEAAYGVTAPVCE